MTDARLLRWGPRTADETPDVSTVTALVFGELVRLAAPVVQQYHSDLYHDAEWLRDNLSGRSLTFYFSARETGTHIGTDDSLVCAFGGLSYRLVVNVDDQVRYTVAIDYMTGVYKQRH